MPFETEQRAVPSGRLCCFIGICRRVYIILILAVIFIFSACSQESNSSESKTSQDDTITENNVTESVSESIDYTEWFELGEIKPVESETESLIEINYSIHNKGKENDKQFAISINGKTEKTAIEPGSSKSNSMSVDLSVPETYNLDIDIKYSVIKDDVEIWESSVKVPYDCTDMFVHKAYVSYKGEKKEIELKDFTENSIELKDIFKAFDGGKKHIVKVNSGENVRAGIGKNNSNVSFSSAKEGSCLVVKTSENKYHFKGNIQIEINDIVTADSVDWGKQMSFRDSANYSSAYISGVTVTLLEFAIDIKNPSDEDVYGTITKFYVNDKALDDHYLSATGKTSIWARDKNSLQSYSGPNIWNTTGEKNIKKFGMKIKIEDTNGKVLYDDIQWIVLK